MSAQFSSPWRLPRLVAPAAVAHSATERADDLPRRLSGAETELEVERQRHGASLAQLHDQLADCSEADQTPGQYGAHEEGGARFQDLGRLAHRCHRAAHER